MSEITIKDVQFLCPKNGVIKTGHLSIKGHEYTEIDAPEEADINAKGQLLIPGACDLAVRTTHLESDYEQALCAGITQFCIQPNSVPETIIDCATPAHALSEHRDEHAPTAHLLGASTKGLGGELLSDMAALKGAGCVALTDAGQTWQNYRTLKRAMEYAQSIGISLHITAQDISLLNNGCAHDGLICSQLGLIGIPDAVETGALAMIIELAHETGARIHINQLSCARSVKLIKRAKKAGVKITADVSIHHLVMNETAIKGYNTLCHIHPPLRSEMDRQALMDGINSGVIDTITSHHQPCTKDSKEAPFPASKAGIATMQWLLPLTLTLCKRNELNLTRAIQALTHNPANIIGQDTIGFVLCDIQSEFVVPETNNTAYSAHPYVGNALTGRVTRTLEDFS